jgi:hypothetical protein
MNLPAARAALAVMTDEETLAHYQQRDPYTSLRTAKELHRVNLRFWHLGARVRARRLGIPLLDDDPA